MSRFRRPLLVFLALAVALLWGGWQWLLRGHHLSVVPPVLEVRRELYSAEEAWGFGPGGNETGIVLYAMPEAARQRIEAGGIEWLNALRGSGRGWQGRYRDWQPTPLAAEAHGMSDFWDGAPRAETCGHGGGIAACMFRYGFCIPFDRGVEALANRALSEAGSFYAFGRIGMLILIPSENRIDYAYNG